MESILNSVKKALGGSPLYDVFNSDLIMFVNSALATLYQLGIGPSTGYSITGESETWNDYFSNDSRLEFIKTYIFLKVKTTFDPPANSFVMTAFENQIKELEWRITVQRDEINER